MLIQHRMDMWGLGELELKEFTSAMEFVVTEDIESTLIEEFTTMIMPDLATRPKLLNESLGRFLVQEHGDLVKSLMFECTDYYDPALPVWRKTDSRT